MNMHVAVYTKDETLFKGIREASAQTNFIVHLNPEFGEYAEDHFILTDVDSFLKQQEKFSAVKKSLLYVLSPGDDESNMKLIDQYGLHHLVGINEGIYGPEVMLHLEKVQRNKIWGLQVHMGPDSDIRVLSLSDSKHSQELVQEALTHFDFKDYFTSPQEYIRVMADELISNSLYKGPAKKRQEQGIMNVDRKAPAFLKGSELVQVTIGMGSTGIGLSVQDSFGGLNYQTLLASLRRSFEEKTVLEKKDGAGLGLYLTFLHSNQFIINYRENFRTEVICIIDKNKRYKSYKQRIRSFHFFQEVPGEKAVNK